MDQQSKTANNHSASPKKTNELISDNINNDHVAETLRNNTTIVSLIESAHIKGSTFNEDLVTLDGNIAKLVYSVRTAFGEAANLILRYLAVLVQMFLCGYTSGGSDGRLGAPNIFWLVGSVKLLLELSPDCYHKFAAVLSPQRLTRLYYGLHKLNGQASEDGALAGGDLTFENAAVSSDVGVNSPKYQMLQQLMSDARQLLGLDERRLTRFLVALEDLALAYRLDALSLRRKLEKISAVNQLLPDGGSGHALKCRLYVVFELVLPSPPATAHSTLISVGRSMTGVTDALPAQLTTAPTEQPRLEDTTLQQQGVTAPRESDSAGTGTDVGACMQALVEAVRAECSAFNVRAFLRDLVVVRDCHASPDTPLTAKLEALRRAGTHLPAHRSDLCIVLHNLYPVTGITPNTIRALSVQRPSAIVGSLPIGQTKQQSHWQQQQQQQQQQKKQKQHHSMFFRQSQQQSPSGLPATGSSSQQPQAPYYSLLPQQQMPIPQLPQVQTVLPQWSLPLPFPALTGPDIRSLNVVAEAEQKIDVLSPQTSPEMKGYAPPALHTSDVAGGPQTTPSTDQGVMVDATAVRKNSETHTTEEESTASPVSSEPSPPQHQCLTAIEETAHVDSAAAPSPSAVGLPRAGGDDSGARNTDPRCCPLPVSINSGGGCNESQMDLVSADSSAQSAKTCADISGDTSICSKTAAAAAGVKNNPTAQPIVVSIRNSSGGLMRFSVKPYFKLNKLFKAYAAQNSTTLSALAATVRFTIRGAQLNGETTVGSAGLQNADVITVAPL